MGRGEVSTSVMK